MTTQNIERSVAANTINNTTVHVRDIPEVIFSSYTAVRNTYGGTAAVCVLPPVDIQHTQCRVSVPILHPQRGTSSVKKTTSKLYSFSSRFLVLVA